MKKIILLALTVIFLIGCNSIARKINGEKKAKKETVESLKNHIEVIDIKIKIEDCLFLKDEETKKILSTYNKYYKSQNYSKKTEQLFLYLFNKEHKLVDEDILGGCILDRPQTKENFYAELLKQNAIIEGNFSLTQLNNSFLDSKGLPINNPFEINKPVLIVVWAKFRGNNHQVAFLNETQRTLITKNPDLQVFYLNIDKVFFD